MQLPQKLDIDSPAIPDRLYFKIGDAARICGVETYVLRFWETQFPQLKPNKSGTGQRLYRRRDVELALKIKHLVHAEGYTLSGARQALEQTQPHRNAATESAPQLEPQTQMQLLAVGSSQTPTAVAATLAHARAELREIAGLLAAQEPQPTRRRARVTTMPPPTGSLFPL